MRKIVGQFFMRFVVWIVVISLVAPVMVHAQDTGGTLPAFDLNDFIGQALIVLTALVGGWATSPITVWAVGFLKRVFKDIPAEWITVAVSLVIIALVAIAAKFGVEAQLRTAISIITGVLAVLAGSGINLQQSAKRYQEALSVQAALTGYQRTGPYAEMRVQTQSVYAKK